MINKLMNILVPKQTTETETPEEMMMQSIQVTLASFIIGGSLVSLTMLILWGLLALISQ